MEVLATRLAHDAGVAAIATLYDAVGDLAVQAAENSRTARVVQRGEILVRQYCFGYFDGVPRDKLDDVTGEPSFEKDVVEDVV